MTSFVRAIFRLPNRSRDEYEEEIRRFDLTMEKLNAAKEKWYEEKIREYEEEIRRYDPMVEELNAVKKKWCDVSAKLYKIRDRTPNTLQRLYLSDQPPNETFNDST